MSEDKSLELLRKKKLLELQMKLLEKQLREKEPKISPKKILESVLTPKAKEILREARRQYPEATERVIEILANYVVEKGIKKIDGVTLYNIFLNLGLPVRIETKIVYKSRGEVKSIRELLKNKED
ncbi:MAG: hypothetical protein DRN04_09335 [Thermoprotei archaeon]|mgnify:CR=1 FL=1|nr:MAG: hypothetical protein DRN04_09335 [Thermoprotei archaeon]